MISSPAWPRAPSTFRCVALAATFVFWASGLEKLFDFAGATGEMAHFGLDPAWLFAAMVILLQLGGSLVVIFGRRWAWLGSGALSAFTLATVPLVHPFWTMQGAAAFVEKALVEEHVSLVGGLIATAIYALVVFQGEE